MTRCRTFLVVGDLHSQFYYSFPIGKSRLAYLNETTLPQLELKAATVSVQLTKTLKKELKLAIDSITFWTDSMKGIRYIADGHWIKRSDFPPVSEREDRCSKKRRADRVKRELKSLCFSKQRITKSDPSLGGKIWSYFHLFALASRTI